MYVPDFEYLAPHTVQETCALLNQLGARAKVLCGGTDLLVKMKHGLLAPEVLVSLKHLSELRGIRYVEGKGVFIGARSTHNDLMNSKVLNEKYLSVSEAAHQMASNQIRIKGTIGGNIVNAVPSADVPPILIALRATITLAGPEGERTLPLEDFFTGPGKSVLAQDEIVTHVFIPDQPTTGSNYMKFGLRDSGALAVVGVATAVTMKGSVIEEARVTLGAVAPVPLRAKKTEESLKGKEYTDELLEQAGVIASQECSPISDIRGSAEYRRDMVRVFTTRSLKASITQGHC
ncbi:MAG: xanthine dehydrogenase family protein subunit M [Deltaproteobacteria bacterium]|nr:xanthine dehydrogenase family protein subunit M [Deltaproteobacteria bacterium]